MSLRILLQLLTCVELNTGLALSPSKNIEQLFQFIIQEDLSKLIVWEIFVPLWHKIIINLCHSFKS